MGSLIFIYIYIKADYCKSDKMILNASTNSQPEKSFANWNVHSTVHTVEITHIKNNHGANLLLDL